jgi:RNA polymerase sigma-70 factor (ECF subfamily)
MGMMNTISFRAHDGAESDTPEFQELFLQVYEELRRLAGEYIRRERPGHTLQPTALVHEAYLKLANQRRTDLSSKTHFFAVSAVVMRQLLIDHARRRGAVKRGAGWHKVTLAEGSEISGDQTFDPEQLLALNDSLDRLAACDKRAARVVTLRLFGGMSPAEVAEVIGVSRRTVSNDWRHALAWLRKELAESIST